MKFSIPVPHLKDVTKRASHILDKDSLLPAGSFIKLTAQSNLLTLQVTHSNASVTIRVEATIIEEGVVGVPGYLFSDIASTCTSSVASFSLEDGKMKMRAGRAVFSMPVLDPETFPTPPDFRFTHMSPVEDLFVKINKVSHCTTEDSLPLYSTILIKTGLVAATDGKRIAILNCEIPTTAPMCVPTKWITEFKKVFIPGAVEVGSFQSFVCLRQGGIEGSIRLLAGSFPNVEKVIPMGAYDQAEVGRLELLAALKNAKVISKDDKTKLIRIMFSNNEMHLSVDTNAGNMEDVVPCSFYKEFEVHLNLELLYDAIRKLERDVVVFTLRHKNALVIQEGELTQLVQPMVKH